MELIKYFNENFSVSYIASVNEHLTQKINTFEKSTHRKLHIKNPFFDNQQEYKRALKICKEEKFEISHIKANLSSYKKLSKVSDCKVDFSFWELEIKKINNDLLPKTLKKNKSLALQKSIYDNIRVTNKLLLNQWGKTLDEEYHKWELSEIEKYRNNFIKDTAKWLNLLQQFHDVMNDLSFDSGLLFDLSKGNISLQEINQLKKWAEYISHNEGVKRLYDLLGRLRKIEKSIKKETIKTVDYIQVAVKDYTSKEEITGVTIGNKIEHILPQELGLLGDEITSVLFDKKLTESELMYFDMEGYSSQTEEFEKEKQINVKEAEKLGTIIICVDTSGSMSGTPETIAKAVTLYMSSRAIKQKRNFYLINFSTTIETLDLSDKLGVKELISFLQRSFHGGTDVAPAMRHALDKMKESNLKKADLLVISDFVMSSLPDDLVNEIKIIKENNNKFYSLAIGNIFLEKKLKTIFDNEWVYNPNNISITELIRITDSIK